VPRGSPRAQFRPDRPLREPEELILDAGIPWSAAGWSKAVEPESGDKGTMVCPTLPMREASHDLTGVRVSLAIRRASL
jgi:hypothetical protein